MNNLEKSEKSNFDCVLYWGATRTFWIETFTENFNKANRISAF